MGRIEQVNENFLPRRELKFRVPGFLRPLVHGMVKDKRDEPLAEFFVNYCCINVACILGFFFVPAMTPYSFLYIIVWFWTLQTTVLYIHFVTHVNPFKPQYNWVRWCIINLMCPLVGLPPGGYEEHHTKMHHVDNNSWVDLSGTEQYERDNPLHFLVYWARFAFCIFHELPMWSVSKGRKVEACWVLLLSLGWFPALYSLYQFNPRATFWSLLVPWGLATILFMFGNWSQHILVDPKNARSSYGLSYNLINSKINLGFWNDGYHLMHHLNSQTPWHDLPNQFLKQQDKIAAKGGLTFTGIVYQNITVWAFTGNYHRIHEAFVPLSEEQDMTLEEFLPFIDEWFRPIYEKGHKETLFTQFLKATSRRDPVYIDYSSTEVKK